MVDRGPALAHVRIAWRGDATDDELVTLTESYGGMSQCVRGLERVALHAISQCWPVSGRHSVGREK